MPFENKQKSQLNTTLIGVQHLYPFWVYHEKVSTPFWVYHEKVYTRFTLSSYGL